MANSELYLNGRQKVIVVPGPLAHRSPLLETADPLFTELGSSKLGQSVSSSLENLAVLEAFPGVLLYECNAAYEVTYVSENISELFALGPNELIGTRLLSDQRMPAEDLALLFNRLEELEHLNKKTSLIHRMLTRHGLPVWVAHSLWKTVKNDTIVVRGCIIPMDYNGQLHTSEQAFISRFVHKLGNHF